MISLRLLIVFIVLLVGIKLTSYYFYQRQEVSLKVQTRIEERKRSLPRYTWRRRPYQVSDDATPFAFLITHREHETFLFILEKFVDLMKRHGLDGEYFLSGGSVLGSLRHHDMIPWDDDIDITFNIRYKAELLSLFQSEGSRITSGKGRFVALEIFNRVKVYYEAMDLLEGSHDVDNDVNFSYSTNDYGVKWPNLDIVFYETGAKEIYETIISYGKNYTYPIDVILPTRGRPFGKLMVPMPRKPYQYATLTYQDLSMCSTHSYCHKFERALGPSVIRPCVDLNSVYAFNKYTIIRDRSSKKKFVLERLTIRAGHNKSKKYFDEYKSRLLEDESFVHSLDLSGAVSN